MKPDNERWDTTIRSLKNITWQLRVSYVSSVGWFYFLNLKAVLVDAVFLYNLLHWNNYELIYHINISWPFVTTFYCLDQTERIINQAQPSVKHLQFYWTDYRHLICRHNVLTVNVRELIIQNANDLNDSLQFLS